MNLGTILRALPRTGLTGVSDQLVVAATAGELWCLERAVSDALGSDSRAVRHQAAFDASHALLAAIANRLGIDGGVELLDLASELHATLGLGALAFEVDATGGSASLRAGIAGSGLLERVGRALPGAAAVDAFSAGFAAAAASVAYPSDWGAFAAEETRCVLRGDAACELSLQRRPVSERRGGAITRADAEQLLGPDAPEPGPPSPAAAAARAFVAEFQSADDGSMRIGASRFAILPAAYRAQLEFDTLHLLEKRPAPSSPVRGASASELTELFTALASESSRRGAFLMLGGLYTSGALRDALGPLPDDPGERAEQLASIASVLGWGELSVLEVVPDLRLVVSAPLTPEAVFYAARHGGTPNSRLPGLRGLAEAIAWLSSSTELGREPVTRDGYLELCRSGPALTTRETRSVLSGDRDSELVVELRPRG